MLDSGQVPGCQPMQNERKLRRMVGQIVFIAARVDGSIEKFRRRTYPVRWRPLALCSTSHIAHQTDAEAAEIPIVAGSQIGEIVRTVNKTPADIATFRCPIASQVAKVHGAFQGEPPD